MNLSYTRVNALSLQVLSKLTNLQSLALYGCDNIKDFGLIQALPTLKCLRVTGHAENEGKVEEEPSININDYVEHGDDSASE